MPIGVRRTPRRTRADRSRNDEDLFKLPLKPLPYVIIGLDNPLLEPLKYTPEQVAERAASGYPQVYSAYEDRRPDGSLKAVFHLHPMLVDPCPAGGEATVIICRQCLLFLRASKSRDPSKKQRTAKAESNTQGFIHRSYSLARGFDFGNTVGCPTLSLLEKVLLGQYCFLGV